MPYTASFRTKIVQKLMQPNGPSQLSVSRDTGVPQTTLSRWMKQARTIAPMSPKNSSRRKKRTADEKLRVLLEASRLPDEELGAFLRREGLHEAQLKEWREAARAGLASLSGDRRSPETQRVKQLESELLRKDKALAELSALMILRKKVQALWGDEDDDTGRNSAK